METCDVLIIGGGPAGSTCAWQLRKYGYDPVIMDKSLFPRDKICAGWIIPQVIESLQLDLADYARNRTLQPFTGFQVGILGKSSTTSRFASTVSYGIRRCEFDDYLLQRSGARLLLGNPVQEIELDGQEWIVNGSIRTPMLVGAGGHFCPVARKLRGAARRPLVTAVEAEFPYALGTEKHTESEIPRLYFCSDLSGYGWCVRKGSYMNIGLGRVDSKEVSSQMPRFLELLHHDGAFSGPLPHAAHGHAYSLYDGSLASILGEGVLLIGDAAGLADPNSGEGIRPAVESGLLAAAAIHAAQKDYHHYQFANFHKQMLARYGRGATPSRKPSEQGFLQPFQNRLANFLIGNGLFSRHVILKNWFLHSRQPALRID